MKANESVLSSYEGRLQVATWHEHGIIGAKEELRAADFKQKSKWVYH